jgi:hypothetical protein
MLNLTIYNFHALFQEVPNFQCRKLNPDVHMKFRTFTDCTSQKQNFEIPEFGSSSRPLNVEVRRHSSFECGSYKAQFLKVWCLTVLTYMCC